MVAWENDWFRTQEWRVLFLFMSQRVQRFDAGWVKLNESLKESRITPVNILIENHFIFILQKPKSQDPRMMISIRFLCEESVRSAQGMDMKRILGRSNPGIRRSISQDRRIWQHSTTQGGLLLNSSTAAALYIIQPARFWKSIEISYKLQNQTQEKNSNFSFVDY